MPGFRTARAGCAGALRLHIQRSLNTEQRSWQHEMSGRQRDAGDDRAQRRGDRLLPELPRRVARSRRARQDHRPDRTSGVMGKSVSVRVDLGGRRIIKKKIRLERTQLKKKPKKNTKHTY